MKTIKIIDTSIKDIFKNFNSENLNIKNFNELFKLIDEINFSSLEIIGGSCFEKMLSNNFNKSPWEIISYIKSIIKNTPLQALIGAKNLVSFDYYPQDIIKRFIKISINHGISIFRVYDALNDIENLKPTINEILNNNGICQGTIIYYPNKDINYYINFISQLKSLGCHSICIKDAESTLIPAKSSELFRRIKNKEVNNSESNISNYNKSLEDIDVFLNTQNLKGVQVLNYFEAISNGCDGVDLSFIPSTYYENFIPSIFPFLLSLKEKKITHNLDITRINELYDLIKEEVYPNLNKNKTFSNIRFINSNKSFLPEWLMVMLENQLFELGELDKIDEVFDEILKIKEEVGNPSLSTPIGQIIGGQAILNTLISNKRWEIVSDEMQLMLSGSFGKLPDEINPKILELINNINYNNNELLNNNIILETKNDNLFEICKNDIKKYSQNEEDILSYCFFADKTLKFLNQKRKIKSNPIEGIKNDKKQELSIKDTIKILDKTKKEQEKFKENIEIDKLREEQMNDFKDLNIEKIREIINLLENSNIEEIKIESDNIKITLNKTKNINLEKNLKIDDLNKLESLDLSTDDSKILKQKSLKEKEETNLKDISTKEFDQNLEKTSSNLIEIKSPIVGTFYASPSPGEPPFVMVGKKVKKGDTLCIIEAMKLMNKINSDYDGIIEEICVSNEEPVEFNQTIMKIRMN